MIKIEISFRESKSVTSVLKQRQFAEAVKRTLKHMAENDFSDYVSAIYLTEDVTTISAVYKKGEE